MMMKANEIIKMLGLMPHPEGGFFRETYRSKDEVSGTILSGKHSGNRNLATSIYYMLESGNVSRLHQLKSDEIWYFHYGSPLSVHIFYENTYRNVILSRDLCMAPSTSSGAGDGLGSSDLILSGFQTIIPAGAIFGAEVIDSNSFSLLGCMVTPGFHFEDFRLVPYLEIIKQFPNYETIISRLT